MREATHLKTIGVTMGRSWPEDPGVRTLATTRVTCKSDEKFFDVGDTPSAN